MSRDQTPQHIFHDASGGPFRGCLVDMVNECMRFKPGDVPADTYFQEQLEPVLTRLAMDLLENNPDNPVAFVQGWIDEEELKVAPSILSSSDNSVPLPLIHMRAWRDRTRAQAMESELQVLRRRFALLEEALRVTSFGPDVLVALKADDLTDLTRIFASCRLDHTGDVSLADACTSTTPRNVGATAKPDAESVFESLGEVLRVLRDRGIGSASSAFSSLGEFQSASGGEPYIERSRFASEIGVLNVLPSERVAELAESLDPEGTGRITYREFKDAVARFLAGSTEFHPSLSIDEFTAVVQRLQRRLRAQGRTLQEAFRGWDAEARGTVDAADFAEGLRSLGLGLSGREVAQVLNQLGREGVPSSPVSSTGGDSSAQAVCNGRVVLSAFEAVIEHCGRQRGLRGWALATYTRLRTALEQGCVRAALQRHLSAPGQQYLRFPGFAALVSEADPSLSPADISSLWCVLDKDDPAEAACVPTEEVVRWMAGAGDQKRELAVPEGQPQEPGLGSLPRLQARWSEPQLRAQPRSPASAIPTTVYSEVQKRLSVRAHAGISRVVPLAGRSLH
mmetsp:Transcript_112967/g.319646  ORF Transcript_112967/g.319646 Transcript_112967/m.319646 type:complete len:565 (-) Transcript_112967:21-1715(-)